MESLRCSDAVDNFSPYASLPSVKFNKIAAADARRQRRDKLAALRRSSRSNFQFNSFGRNHMVDRRKSRFKRSNYGNSLPRTNSASSEIDDEEIAGDSKREEQRQQRMLRNRESAAQSRKRKREEYERLEDKIRMLTEENEALKKKLEMYENHSKPGSERREIITSNLSSNVLPPPSRNCMDNKDGIQQISSAMEESKIECQHSLGSDLKEVLSTEMRVPGNSSACSFNREFAVPANSYT